jgi:hypothetical protein
MKTKPVFFTSLFSSFHLQLCKQSCPKNQDGFKSISIILGHKVTIISDVILCMTHLVHSLN